MIGRGGFLRSLLAAPAVAIGHVKEAASAEHAVPQARVPVLSVHANRFGSGRCGDGLATGRLYTGKPEDLPCQESQLVWSHDAAGNWYLENTLTGKVTRL